MTAALIVSFVLCAAPAGGSAQVVTEPGMTLVIDEANAPPAVLTTDTGTPSVREETSRSPRARLIDSGHATDVRPWRVVAVGLVSLPFSVLTAAAGTFAPYYFCGITDSFSETPTACVAVMATGAFLGQAVGVAIAGSALSSAAGANPSLSTVLLGLGVTYGIAAALTGATIAIFWVSPQARTALAGPALIAAFIVPPLTYAVAQELLWNYRDRPRDDSAPSVAIAPIRGGAMLAAGWRF